MDSELIYEKFGDNFIADENTFIMGINQYFTSHFAKRFKNLNTLETCTGAGFTTISLAKTAKHVFTVEINKSHQDQAKSNLKRACLLKKVSFIHGNIGNKDLLSSLPDIDAAFIDPDWAVTGNDHKYRFINSNTKPPADTLLDRMLELTKNVAVVLPPFIDINEFKNLPEHEMERLYLGDSHELFCLYFGNLVEKIGETQFIV